MRLADDDAELGQGRRQGLHRQRGALVFDLTVLGRLHGGGAAAAAVLQCVVHHVRDEFLRRDRHQPHA